MFCCPLLNYWSSDVLDFVEVAASKKNEQALVEDVFVDLRDARAVLGAPQLIVAPDQLAQQQGFIHSPITMRQRLQEDFAALKIIG
ncbi:hypothetical protein ASF18_11345 [Methylobacterium sp. Leaf89]|nr:hypothetical protein ASF18_11345 [Methylobacterium sp. Leaf89]